jgi:hypothetical protein
MIPGPDDDGENLCAVGVADSEAVAVRQGRIERRRRVHPERRKSLADNIFFADNLYPLSRFLPSPDHGLYVRVS